VAIEASDITLISGSLAGVVTAVDLSRATMRNIRENLVFAFGYNTIGIPIAAGVLFPFLGLRLSPMIAAAAMAISSLSVVTNSNRLRGFRSRSLTKTTGDRPAAEPQVEIPVEKAAEMARGEDMAGETRAIDPVCGMSVDPATAEYRSFRDGKDYYFCSAGCKESFDRDPGKYTATGSTGSRQHH